MSRLPIPGSDDGVWGSVLNDYLSVEHTADGSLKRGIIVLVYNPSTNSYPARPSGVPAGHVHYKGPVAPTDALAPDTWEDTSGIWP